MTTQSTVVIQLSVLGAAAPLADHLLSRVETLGRSGNFTALHTPKSEYATVDLVVGEVNGLDETALLATIRESVEDPGWKTFEPLTVLVHHQDAYGSHPPRSAQLSYEGVWTPLS